MFLSCFDKYCFWLCAVVLVFTCTNSMIWRVDQFEVCWKLVCLYIYIMILHVVESQCCNHYAWILRNMLLFLSQFLLNGMTISDTKWIRRGECVDCTIFLTTAANDAVVVLFLSLPFRFNFVFTVDQHFRVISIHFSSRFKLRSMFVSNMDTEMWLWLLQTNCMMFSSFKVMLFNLWLPC